MSKLNDQQISKEMQKLDNKWEFNKNKITREIKFNDFVEAFSFMTSVAIIAEKQNHHPDWQNSYNVVIVSLTSHDIGGLSKKDFELAAAIDKLKRF